MEPGQVDEEQISIIQSKTSSFFNHVERSILVDDPLGRELETRADSWIIPIGFVFLSGHRFKIGPLIGSQHLLE